MLQTPFLLVQLENTDNLYRRNYIVELVYPDVELEELVYFGRSTSDMNDYWS